MRTNDPLPTAMSRRDRRVRHEAAGWMWAARGGDHERVSVRRPAARPRATDSR